MSVRSDALILPWVRRECKGGWVGDRGWAEGTEVAGLVGALCVFMVVRGAIAAEDPPSLGTRVNCRVGTSITGRPKITRRGPLGAAGEDTDDENFLRA